MYKASRAELHFLMEIGKHMPIKPSKIIISEVNKDSFVFGCFFYDTPVKAVIYGESERIRVNSDSYTKLLADEVMQKYYQIEADSKKDLSKHA